MLTRRDTDSLRFGSFSYVVSTLIEERRILAAKDFRDAVLRLDYRQAKVSKTYRRHREDGSAQTRRRSRRVQAGNLTQIISATDETEFGISELYSSLKTKWDQRSTSRGHRQLAKNAQIQYGGAESSAWHALRDFRSTALRFHRAFVELIPSVKRVWGGGEGRGGGGVSVCVKFANPARRGGVSF